MGETLKRFGNVALRVVLVVVFILAPLAWSAAELGYTLIVSLAKWASTQYPDTAAAWGLQKVGATSLDAWIEWLLSPSEEGWIATVLLTIFAAIGAAYFSGILGRISCALYRFFGWGAVILVLRWMSAQMWTVLAPSVMAGLTYREGSEGEPWRIVVLVLVIAYGSLSLSVVWDWIKQFQETMQSAFIGDVDPAFPRQSASIAGKCAEQRRRAISDFLNNGKLPPRHAEKKFSNGVPVKQIVREYVERLQEISPDTTVRAPAFLEFPRGSPMVVEQACIEGAEEIAGQYVRLSFEAEPAARATIDAPEEVLVLLLSRVVDAAILADRYFDGLREEKHWNAMPFFERIYVDYRPIPRPLICFLGPILGDALPARVVIETNYPEVFKGALGTPKRNAYRNWFGIGIKIETPNLPQDFFSRLLRQLGMSTTPAPVVRTAWSPLVTACRRLKSRVAGGISGKLTLHVTTNGPGAAGETFHVLSSGPLADGCPSVVSPQLLLRGSVSNAPPLWLFPGRDNLFTDCKGICVKSVPKDDAQIAIDPGNFGKIHSAAGDIVQDTVGPQKKTYRRAVWIGAFFDRELRQANRFPISGCREVAFWRFTSSAAYRDLRGAFVRLKEGWWARWHSDSKGDDGKALAGVFVSTLGPSHASNLLLPEPLLNDYLTHLVQAPSVVALMPPCEGPPFVPKPEHAYAR